MERRVFGAAAVAATLACVSPAAFATQPDGSRAACGLVADASGDTYATVPDGQTEQLDITGGDIAMDRRRLTVVVRLNTLASRSVSPTGGRLYEFRFTANGKNFVARAALVPGGEDYDYQAYLSSEPATEQQAAKGEARPGTETGIGRMSGVIDTKAREIRMTAPLSLFTKHATFERTSVNNLAAFTYSAQGVNLSDTTPKVFDGSAGSATGVDSAYSSKEYKPYSPSCVVVGS